MDRNLLEVIDYYLDSKYHTAVGGQEVARQALQRYVPSRPWNMWLLQCPRWIVLENLSTARKCDYNFRA